MRQELKQTYWPLEMTAMDKGFVFELRSQLAWELIQRFALIAADDGGRRCPNCPLRDICERQEGRRGAAPTVVGAPSI